MYVYKYQDLMNKLLENELIVEDFEKRFLNYFRVETVRMSDELFNILNELFEILVIVDGYWTRFSKIRLKMEAKKALLRLNSIDCVRESYRSYYG
ncbi:hypothetical protein SAMN05428981_107107 [Bacillus sp. OV194]|nr:hypothetical protein SAMN05428981_107107 [Bacillus sp. OV194]